MSTAQRNSKQLTVSFPPEMAAQVEQIARAENRSTSELLREAFRGYRAKYLRKLLDEAQRIAERHSPNLTSDDLVSLAKQTRAEIALERKANKRAKSR